MDQPSGVPSSILVPLANDIATAPGDLPVPDIFARFAALERQFRHDNTIVPLTPRPDTPVQVLATSGTDMHLERASLFYTTDGSWPDVGARRVPVERDGVEWTPTARFLTCWRCIIPAQPAGTLVRYRLGGWRAGDPEVTDREPDVWANDGQGFWFRFPGTSGVTTFAYTVERRREPLPDWMSGAVVYQIFLDRFRPDDAFREGVGPRERHGGTITGVRQALPYLAELGVTCLWLSPIGPSETYHRYDTMDYFGIDPELGSAQDLRDLITDAHDRGMRIWLDFVPSHVSWRHPAFQAAQRDRAAPTSSWFTFEDWPNTYRTFIQAAPTLPSVNTADPGARAHLLDAARFWLQAFDVDGYRLDHAIGPSMDFWTALRVATEEIKADVVLVGEATDTPDCLRRYAGRLHGILDFPLARALRHCFGSGDWDLAQLDSFLRAYERFMADGPGRVSFLDNHDMDRFLWVAGNDTRRLTMAAVCQFTVDATPVVYYGTEIGMTQTAGAAQIGRGGDAEARRNMVWDERDWDHDVLALYRALIRLRRDEPALQRGPRQTLHLDTAKQTYAYLRTPPDGAPGASTLVAAFNMSEEAREIQVQLPSRAATPSLLLATSAQPSVGSTAEGVSIALAPMSAAILRV